MEREELEKFIEELSEKYNISQDDLWDVADGCIDYDNPSMDWGG